MGLAAGFITQDQIDDALADIEQPPEQMAA
jgi:hypothetical protein